MTGEAARVKLKKARLKARKLREEINSLRQMLWDAGTDPDSDEDIMREIKRCTESGRGQDKNSLVNGCYSRVFV